MARCEPDDGVVGEQVERASMAEQIWDAVDRYIAERLVGEDDALRAVLTASDAVGLPAGTITSNQGKLLELLVRVHGAHQPSSTGSRW